MKGVEAEQNASQQQVDEYRLEYPVIVYIEDDSSKISLCNLLQPMKPQKQIHFKNYIVKNFVGGSNMFSRYQTAQLNVSIAMLVTRISKPDNYWLLVLSFCPFNNKLIDNNA